MQTGQRIWKDCKRCLGDGKVWKRNDCTLESGLFSAGPTPTPSIVGGEEIDCPTCDGLGIIPWGWLRDEKEDTMPGEEA